MKNTEKIKRPTMVTPYNAQHIGSRDEQQDYFAYSNIFDRNEQKRAGIAAVLADGMGGMANGRQASHTATDVFLKSYINSEQESVRARMVHAAQRANEAVQMLDGAGSTLAAVVIKDWNLHWLSIGDSRIYLFRKNNLVQLNDEHNYAAVLDKMVINGEISQDEALNNPHRAALTSYLGIDDLQEIDANMNNFPLRIGDSLLLCSDGLYRALSDAEINSIIMEADDDVCDALVEKALSKHITNQDNITVMLMDID